MIVSEPKAHQHALSLCGVGMRLSRLPAMEANIQSPSRPYPFHHLLSRLATLNITQPPSRDWPRLCSRRAATVHVINIINIHRTRPCQMDDPPVGSGSSLKILRSEACWSRSRATMRPPESANKIRRRTDGRAPLAVSAPGQNESHRRLSVPGRQRRAQPSGRTAR